MEAVKHSKGDSMDYIAQFRVMNPIPAIVLHKHLFSEIARSRQIVCETSFEKGTNQGTPGEEHWSQDEGKCTVHIYVK